MPRGVLQLLAALLCQACTETSVPSTEDALSILDDLVTKCTGNHGDLEQLWMFAVQATLCLHAEAVSSVARVTPLPWADKVSEKAAARICAWLLVQSHSDLFFRGDSEGLSESQLMQVPETLQPLLDMHPASQLHPSRLRQPPVIEDVTGQ